MQVILSPFTPLNYGNQHPPPPQQTNEEKKKKQEKRRSLDIRTRQFSVSVHPIQRLSPSSQSELKHLRSESGESVSPFTPLSRRGPKANLCNIWTRPFFVFLRPRKASEPLNELQTRWLTPPHKKNKTKKTVISRKGLDTWFWIHALSRRNKSHHQIVSQRLSQWSWHAGFSPRKRTQSFSFSGASKRLLKWKWD